MGIEFSQLINKAEIIVEGKVIEKSSFYHGDRIYTDNKIEIYSILKSGSSIINTTNVITKGGRVDDVSMGYAHNLSFRVGDEGVFFLEPSSLSQGSFRVIGLKNGYFKASNRFEGMYYAFGSVFSSKDELKDEIYNYTQENEIKILERGCLKFAIEIPSASNVLGDDLYFQISVSSEIENTFPVSISIPILYDPSEFNSDPFDSEAIMMDLSSDWSLNYDLNMQRNSGNKITYSITLEEDNLATELGEQFIPLLQGTVDFSQLDIQDLPSINILEDGVISNSFFARQSNVMEPFQNWDCSDLITNGFNELTPRIDSIAPLNVAAGVGSVSENEIPGEITIYGSGFGIPPAGSTSNGRVGFPNGEGISKIIPQTPLSLIYPAELDYISWSDSIIRVRVPSRENNTDADFGQGVATTGSIQVEVNGVNTVSSQDLYVHFGMFNDYFQDPSSNQIGSQKRRMSARFRDINPNVQGYRFRIDQSVLDSIPNAFNLIEEALDEWRCNTDHPIWAEIDTLPTGLYTGEIIMNSQLDSTTIAQTRLISDHHDCEVSVSNLIGIQINPKFVFANFSVPESDTVNFKKIMIHEFGHGFLARHTINRSIMYPFDIFQNITTLTADDHLCGEHSFKLGNSGPQCEPEPNPILFNLNIGTFSCGLNSVFSQTKNQPLFDIYPNPTNSFFNVDLNPSLDIRGKHRIEIIDSSGKLIKKLDRIENSNHVNDIAPGLYFVKLNIGDDFLGVQKLIIYE